MAVRHNTEAGRVAGAIQGGNAADRLIDEHDAADRLGLSVKTLRRWRWARKGLPFVKVGTASVRYSVRDIAAFVEAGRQTTGDAA